MLLWATVHMLKVGIGTKNPDNSPALDVRLPNKGVLLSGIALTGTTDRHAGIIRTE